MLIGAFGDVHGNYTAMLAVWNAMTDLGVTSESVLNAGDSVCYGDQPEESVRFLMEHTKIVSVQGNYDRTVAQFPQRQNEYHKKWARLRPDKYDAIRRDSDLISDDVRVWLAGLPREKELRINGMDVILTHYSPGSKEGIGPWTDDATLLRIAARTTARVVVCGHTHFPFVRTAGGVLFVNPGACGRSGGPDIPFAVISLQSECSPSAQLYRVTRT